MDITADSAVTTSGPAHNGLGPQLLPLNQVEHFYRGGQRIADFRRGEPSGGGARRPEEWIASVTTMASDGSRGLSRLADGTLLKNAIEADPRGWLGPQHVDRYGTSTELLVKLLDAGQRLPVHLHPDRAFARRHLGLPHGKTEAWIVLDVAEGARVRLGFAESMRRSQVRALVDAEDSEALVRSLRARAVRPGDAVLVPAGLPHCIDAGVFLLELQEPTDLSILLEAQDLAVDPRRDGHLGLGFDVALDAVRLDALTESDLDALVVPAERTDVGALADLLPVAARPYFRAHRLRADHTGSDTVVPAGFGTVAPAGSAAPAVTGSDALVPAGFAVVLALAGAGRLLPARADGLDLRRGDVAVVPFAAGDWRVAGSLEVLVCRPPIPPAALR